MTVSYFVIYEGTAAASTDFIDYYLGRHVELVKRFPGLRALSVLTPLVYDDPYLGREHGPLLVTHMTFADIAALESAVLSEARLTARSDVANFPPFEGRATYQAMQDEYQAPTMSRAPVCFFVTYRRPAENEAAFVEFYRRSHMPLLAQFPRVREVAMFTPVPWRDQPFVTRDDLMLVNLTAFDSTAEFHAALASEARKKVREDFDRFPPFTGRCTHTAMMRRTMHP
jgi:uncharacterized protein (TIGR02118 family)